MTAAPTASIIMATYNRSYVLRYAIASVLRSDFSDFEVIVVGDGCTDDTEEVVRGFADPRIRFVNLPTNSGAQSAPNNAGVALARGRYILFLNHDDLYFADHIGASIAFLERTEADIAWSPALVLETSGRESGPPDAERDVIGIHGAVADAGFDPQTFIIASSWIVRAEVCRAVGPWRAPETTRLSPSQEWLFRAHRQGRRLAYHRHISVLCIYGGTRKHSYLIRSSPEHARAWTWITGADAPRAALLACATLEQAAQAKNNRDWVMRFRAEGRFPRVRKLAVSVLRRFGVHPVTVERLFEGTAKGDWIAEIRRFHRRGAGPCPGPNPLSRDQRGGAVSRPRLASRRRQGPMDRDRHGRDPVQRRGRRDRNVRARTRGPHLAPSRDSGFRPERGPCPQPSLRGAGDGGAHAASGCRCVLAEHHRAGADLPVAPDRSTGPADARVLGVGASPHNGNA